MKDVLNTCIRETLHALGVEGETYAITRPDTAEHGEYTTNAALLSAKQLGTSPMEIAELLKKKLEALEHTAIEKVTVAPPGFLNIHLSRDFFCATAREACELGAQWGSNTDETGREVLIEYMSPNLFKSLHVGNLVGTTVGESLSRLFEVSGARVHRITYPSDIGLTVAKAVWGLRHENGNPEDIESLGAAYRLGSEAYDSDATAKRDIDAVNAALYTGTDTELMAMRETGKQTSLAHITDICRMFDTTFSETIFESEAAPVGLQAVREHTADGIFTEDAGAVIFRGERHDLHTRVFVNTAGFPTYEAKDLGNFSIKQDRFPEWDISLVVTGNEQREYFQVINAAIREVFSVDEAKVLEHVATGFLTLTGGKMSSRKGTVLTADSVITELCQEAMARVATMRTADVKKLSEQIAVGALKWWILRRQVSGNSVFDRARAFSFEGDSGPYLQYTHARACSLLKTAKERGIDISWSPPTEKGVYPPERLLCYFNEVVATARVKRSPHHVVSYLLELAGSFNTWYAKEKIADPDNSSAGYKVGVVQACAVTMRNGLWVLGIPAPESM